MKILNKAASWEKLCAAIASNPSSKPKNSGDSHSSISPSRTASIPTLETVTPWKASMQENSSLYSKKTSPMNRDWPEQSNSAN